MLHGLMLTLIWTFNLSALLLGTESRWLKRVVVNSWNLLVLLVGVELIWSLWALLTGQPPLVTMAALWLGVNLLVTFRIAREHARELEPRQITLLCSWWLGLLAMVVHAVVAGGMRGS